VTDEQRVIKVEVDLLVMHLLRMPEVIQVAYGKLKPEHFTEEHEKPHAVLWRATKDFWDKYHKVMEPEYAKAEVARLVQNLPEYGQPFFDAAHEIIRTAWTLESPLSWFALEILNRFLWERTVGVQAAAAMEEHGGTIPRHIWDQLTATGQQIAIAKGEEFTPFGEGVHLLGALERIPCGVIFLDQLLDGGFLPGEVYAFLAPTGGCKTLLAVQLCVEVARRGVHAIVFSYEGCIDANWMVRAYTYGTGLHKNVIKKAKTPADFTPAERAVYERAHKEIGSRLHIIDMGKSTGGVEEFAARMRDFREKGIKPAGVVLDWFSPMFERSDHASGGGRYDSDAAKRARGHIFVDRLKQIARENNCWIWLNHQIGAAQSTRKRLEWNDAAEFRQLAYYLDGCFTLTGYSDSGFATLRFSKARDAKKGHLIVKIRGEYGRIEWADNFERDERSGEYVERDAGHQVASAVDAGGAAEVSQREKYENTKEELTADDQ